MPRAQQLSAAEQKLTNEKLDTLLTMWCGGKWKTLAQCGELHDHVSDVSRSLFNKLLHNHREAIGSPGKETGRDHSKRFTSQHNGDGNEARTILQALIQALVTDPAVQYHLQCIDDWFQSLSTQSKTILERIGQANNGSSSSSQELSLDPHKSSEPDQPGLTQK